MLCFSSAELTGWHFMGRLSASKWQCHRAARIAEYQFVSETIAAPGVVDNLQDETWFRWWEMHQTGFRRINRTDNVTNNSNHRLINVCQFSVMFKSSRSNLYLGGRARVLCAAYNLSLSLSLSPVGKHQANHLKIYYFCNYSLERDVPLYLETPSSVS